MNATSINILLAATYLVGGYFCLFESSYLAAALMLGIVFTIMLQRRPDGSESVLQWQGVWVPFYVPRS
jgi:hypothetical protein